MEVENDPELSRSLAAFGAPNLKYYRFGSRSVRTTLGQPMTPVQRAPARGAAVEQRPLPPGVRSRTVDTGPARTASPAAHRPVADAPSAAKMFPLLGSAMTEAADVSMMPQWRAPAENNLPNHGGVEVALPAGVVAVPRRVARAPDLRSLAAQAAHATNSEASSHEPQLGHQAPFVAAPAFLQAPASQPAATLEMPPSIHPAPIPEPPLQPAPLQPAPLQPAPLQPASLQPAPMHTPPMQPVQMQPAHMQPAHIQAESLQPGPMPQPPMQQTMAMPMMQPGLYPAMMPPMMGMPYGYMYPGVASAMPGMWPPMMVHPGVIGQPAYPGAPFGPAGFQGQLFPGQFYPPDFANQPPAQVSAPVAAPAPKPAPTLTTAEPEPTPSLRRARTTRMARIRHGAAVTLPLAASPVERAARRAAVAADLFELARQHPADVAPRQAPTASEPAPPAEAAPCAEPTISEAAAPGDRPLDLTALAFDLSHDVVHQAEHPLDHARGLLAGRETTAAATAPAASFFAPLHNPAPAWPDVAEPAAAAESAAETNEEPAAILAPVPPIDQVTLDKPGGPAATGVAPTDHAGTEPPIEASIDAAGIEAIGVEVFETEPALAPEVLEADMAQAQPVEREAAEMAKGAGAVEPAMHEPAPAWRGNFFSALRGLSGEAHIEHPADAAPADAAPVDAAPADAARVQEPASLVAEYHAATGLTERDDTAPSHDEQYREASAREASADEALAHLGAPASSHAAEPLWEAPELPHGGSFLAALAPKLQPAPGPAAAEPEARLAAQPPPAAIEQVTTASANFLATLAAPVLAARALAAKVIEPNHPELPPEPVRAHPAAEPPSGAAFFAALRDLDAKLAGSPVAEPQTPEPWSFSSHRAADEPSPLGVAEAVAPAGGVFDGLKRHATPEATSPGDATPGHTPAGRLGDKPLRDLLRRL